MAPRYPSCPLPVADATTSYWLSQPESHLANFKSAPRLPSEAESVIVGSGISGALIAHELQARSQPGNDSLVVMLEARSVCSGASGRNGGHIKPDCYKHFAAFQSKYGTQEAIRLCRFEMENMRDSVAFIRAQGLAGVCDLVETRAVDVFMTPEAWRDALVSIEAYREAAGPINHIEMHDPEQMEKEGFRFKGSYGAVSYPACSLWPYKLAVTIIKKAVNNGLQLFTNTPALSIEPVSQSSSPATTKRWLVKTGRGDMRCNKIFHATNGFVSQLLPEFAGKVVPLKGNVVALNPPPSYLDQPMGHTAGVQWGDDFDYMIQRPNDGLPLIFGGRDLAHPRGYTAGVGDWDDSITTPEILQSLQDFPARHITGWDKGNASLRFAWSGIMGLTADELPFVGAVPGKIGQYTASGYSGHGMARVFLTIQALMQQCFGEEIDPRVPSEYFNISDRLMQRNESWETMLRKNLEAETPERFRVKI